MTTAPSVPNGEEIEERLKDFIKHRGQGLRNMYDQPGGQRNGKLEGAIKKGEEMAKKLIMEMGCTGEVAKDLILLTLYDVAILIDDSDSMIWEENGKRKKTLVKFIDDVWKICSFANESGTPTMRFMNRAGDTTNWAEKWQEYLDHHSYGGLSRIGTELKKILDRFAVGNPNQRKPLLVLIVTDGVVEGERKGHLRNVIRKCLDRCEAGARSDVVAFQFSCIGKNTDGAQLLVELDQDPYIGDSIDVFQVGLDLERQSADKWFMWGKQDDHSADEEEYSDSGEDWDDQ